MMTLSYNIGLTLGSLIGYVFDSMLGPQIINPCPQFPFIPTDAPVLNTTPTTTAAATIQTIVSTLKTTSLAPTRLLPSTASIIPTTVLPFSRETSRSTLTTFALSTIGTIVAGLANGGNSTTAIQIVSTTASPLSLPLSTAISTSIFNNSSTPSLLHN